MPFSTAEEIESLQGRYVVSSLSGWDFYTSEIQSHFFFFLMKIFLDKPKLRNHEGTGIQNHLLLFKLLNEIAS